MKFNLHHSTKLTDKEKNFCTCIESSLLPFDELAPILLEDDTLEGYKFEANPLSSKEMAFELIDE